MQIKGIDFILYNVSDYKRAVDFYRDILGLKLIEEYGGYWGEFSVGTTTLVISAGNSVSNGRAVVALALDDLKKSIEYLKTKKIRISKEPHETGVCFMATILDPDGNEIILHQKKTDITVTVG